MTKLYLVRHGETDWNKENRCQGCIDIDLNVDGIEQSEKIAQRLSGESIDIIYSSELKRACSTADIIAKRFSCRVIRNSALNEIDFGVWEGLTFEELRKRPDYNYTHWKKSPEIVTFPGEGSLKRVQDRAMSLVNEIINNNKGKNILLVSHGAILKTIILGLLGIGLEAYNKFYMTNAALSVLTINDEGSHINTLNDTCHLNGIVKTKPIF